MFTRNISDFKAGRMEQQYQYESFLPSHISVQWILDNTELMLLMGEADRQLGSLDAYADLVPDIDFFIKMHITKEATTSSKIEGTRTSFQEALAAEEYIESENRDDWLEVNNYVNAMNYAILELNTLPLSSRLIKNTHQKLLTGARGKDKLPGEFRQSQNWIGPSLRNAVFIPPKDTHIPDLMHDLENMMNAEYLARPLAIPYLLRIAMVHYQFETIHPFLDGNGRIGRLLITLYLMDKKILKRPILYLSDFFERNRRDYYDYLMQVRLKDDMESWLKFFLTGIIETSQKSIQTFKGIIALRRRIEYEQLPQLGRKQPDAKRLITAFYKQPIMDGKLLAESIDVHASTANRLVKNLMGLGLVKELTGFNRNRIYAFDPYIKLF